MAWIEFTKRATESRVRTKNFVDEVYEIVHERGKQMEVSPASAFHWVVRNVAKEIEQPAGMTSSMLPPPPPFAA